MPFGLLALAGIFAASKEGSVDKSRLFDWMGFAWLGLGIASLQIMLDRGQVQDWYCSTEIIVESTIAALAFYLFIVHTLTAKDPFIAPRLFCDRNLLVGLVLITVVGVILFATMALLPPYLETLMDYPVVTTGLVLAPRGIGTMIAMFIVGRLVNRIDIRLIMAFGMLLTIYSLWEMSRSLWPGISTATRRPVQRSPKHWQLQSGMTQRSWRRTNRNRPLPLNTPTSREGERVESTWLS